MRVLRLVLIALVFMGSSADANTLNGFFPIAPQMSEDGISDWDEAEVTTGFQGRLSRLQIPGNSYTYYLNHSWTDSPVGTPEDYITSFPGSSYDMVVSHANSSALALTYWSTAAARNTYWNSFLTQSDRDTYFYKNDDSPGHSILARDTGITKYMKLNGQGMVIVLGCESTNLADNFFPGISEQNDQSSGSVYAGYDYCMGLDVVARNAKAFTQCLTCNRWPIYGGDLEDAARYASYPHVRGYGGRRLNQAMSCWDWTSYFYAAGYKNGEVFCSVLNEDAESHYIIRGYAGGLPDTIATFSGLGTDGKWVLRTHHWALSPGSHTSGDIISVDKDGISSVSAAFGFTSNDAKMPAAGDIPVSSLENNAVSGPPDVQEVGERPLVSPPDGDCADVVIYSSDYNLLTPVRDHCLRYNTPHGYPLKVKVYFGPNAFSSIQSTIATVQAANATYMDQCDEACPRTFPVNPGPIGILVGDYARVHYNTWDDDPIANPCRQPVCRSYNDAGDINGDHIAECPVEVIDAMGVDSLLARLATADDWNAGRFVESSGRALFLAGDYTSYGPAEVISAGLDRARAGYIAMGTPTLLLRESDYSGWQAARAAVVPQINAGIETLWFQGAATGLDAYTYFMSGPSNFPRDQLTKKQRYLALGPSCEVNGIQWLGSEGSPGWMYRCLGLNDPEKSVMIGVVGQINGDFEHRHELAIEVFQHEWENRAPWEFLAETLWRANHVMATQFGEINYARGSTLFANGLIYGPRGRYSTTGVETPPADRVKTARMIWSVPLSAGRDIHFRLASQSRVRLEVYNVAGAKIATVIDGERLGAGLHQATWYGRTSNGEKVGSGVYFANLTVHGPSGSARYTDKLVVVR